MFKHFSCFVTKNFKSEQYHKLYLLLITIRSQLYTPQIHHLILSSKGPMILKHIGIKYESHSTFIFVALLFHISSTRISILHSHHLLK